MTTRNAANSRADVIDRDTEIEDEIVQSRTHDYIGNIFFLLDLIMI
jgi:hypothetical protein